MLSASALAPVSARPSMTGSLRLTPQRTSVFRQGPAPQRTRRMQRVQTQAMFGGAGKGKSAGSAYICKDCGYIEVDFESQPKGYRCPVCSAPKKRFAVYKEPLNRNANSTATRKARKAELQSGGGSGPNPAVLVGAGIAILAALYIGLNTAL